MVLFTRIMQILTGLAGLAALTLGLLQWFTSIHLVEFHMLLGLIVTLCLLILSIAMLFISGMRVWGVVGVICAIIVPTFGLNQMTILVGSSHWLIQTLHLLIGLGAMALAGIMGTRYQRMVAEGGEAVATAKAN